MIFALEIVTGLVVTSALAAGTCILAAFELGRMATQDAEQRDAGARIQAA